MDVPKHLNWVKHNPYIHWTSKLVAISYRTKHLTECEKIKSNTKAVIKKKQIAKLKIRQVKDI